MHASDETAFATSLTQLYYALADADTLVTPIPPVVAQGEALQARFLAFSGDERAHFLLRALDEAIAAIEVAAGLAETYHGAAAPASQGGEGVAEDPLASSYAAFVASQPFYQSLYHYRNALAALLRQPERKLPDAVAQPAPPDEAPPAH
jgi:hypothetical protein